MVYPEADICFHINILSTIDGEVCADAHISTVIL
jgi:hypothetical protein